MLIEIIAKHLLKVNIHLEYYDGYLILDKYCICEFKENKVIYCTDFQYRAEISATDQLLFINGQFLKFSLKEIQLSDPNLLFELEDNLKQLAALCYE